jgi:DnaJ-class molecular chaperone
MSDRLRSRPIIDSASLFSSTPVFPQWQGCPVCAGRGTMHHDFYTGVGASTSTERVQCKTCKGATVVAPPGIAGSPKAAGGEPTG